MADYLKFRKDATFLTLSGNYKASYPNEIGDQYYNSIGDYPKYIDIARDFQSTEYNAEIENIKWSDFSATIRPFWTTTLKYGEYAFNAIDNMRRILFDCYWDEFETEFNPVPRDVGNISIRLTSPHSFTPSVFAYYDMSDGDMTDFIGDSGNELTLINGIMLIHSGTSIPLTNLGYALRANLTSASATAASSSTISWKSYRGPNAPFSMMCEFYIPALSSGKSITIMKISNNMEHYRIYLEESGGDQNLICAYKNHDGSETTIGAWAVTAATWYAVGLSVNPGIGKAFAYLWAEQTTSSWNNNIDTFLITESTTITKCKSVALSAADTPPYTGKWNYVELLAYTSGAISGSTYGYIQHPIFIDGWISPVVFNYIRRLYHKFNFSWLPR